MSTVEIQSVETNSQQKQFLNYPWELYKGDENWIPPIRINNRELVGFGKHPFYDNADAQQFLALREGKIVGRISAIINHVHNKKYKEKRGIIGFFESIDDQSVADALFQAAGKWFAQQGMTDMRGPINPSLNHECGMLVEGFDSPPTFMMTYNPPYYEKLWTGYGFEKSQDLFAYYGHVDMLDSLDKKMEFIVQEATKRLNVTLRNISTKNFKEDVRAFLNIYNKSLEGTWGFTPMSAGEIEKAAAEMKHLIVPEMTAFAEIDGKVVGVVFGLLDYNPRIKLINGSLYPFGFIRLLWNKRAIKRVRMISTNVLPEYQRWGIGLLLHSHIYPQVANGVIEEVEFSWVLESNKLSRGTLERGGAKLIKTYRIFDRKIE